MSYYVDVILAAEKKAKEPEVIATQLAHAIFDASGRDVQTDDEEFGTLRDSIVDVLDIIEFREAELMIRWLFEIKSFYWRDKLCESDLPGAQLYSNLEHIVDDFRADPSRVRPRAKLGGVAKGSRPVT